MHQFGQEGEFLLRVGGGEIVVFGQVVAEPAGEVVERELADVVGVDGFKFFLVETRRVGQHVGDVEVFDEFRHAENVSFVREGPAQEGQVVQHSLGDDSGAPVVEQIGLGVAFGEFFVPLPHDERQVAELGGVVGHADSFECLVKGELAGGGGQQVFATQDVGDAHDGVVDRVDQGVERGAVGAGDHEVGLTAGLEFDVTTDQVGPGPVGVGHAEPPHGFAALGFECGDLCIGEVAVVIVVAEFGVAAGGFVPGFDFLGGGVCGVDESALFEFF